MKKILLFILLLAAACNTVKKQQRKAEQFYLLHPEKLAQNCAETFPAKDTSYKPGKVIVKSDTVTIKGDSVPCPPYVSEKGETTYVKVKCPDSKIIHDTIIQVDTLEVDKSVAEKSYLRFQNDSLRNELNKVIAAKNKAEKQSRNRLWILIALIGIMGVGIYIKIKKIL